MTLQFLRYGIERKMGVILRCKQATHNEQLSELPCVSLFQISQLDTFSFWPRLY